MSFCIFIANFNNRCLYLWCYVKVFLLNCNIIFLCREVYIILIYYNFKILEA